MNRGYLHSVVWIVLVTLLTLLTLNWLPDVTVGDWQMRRVDLLADLRPDSVRRAKAVLESLDETAVTTASRVVVDSCRSGMTCIDDMADDDDRGMNPLYRALSGIDTLGRPVRIAVLGDSFIEGDILTQNLRQLLQKHYGGCGVGYVPLTSDAPGFRRSVKHRFNDRWAAHNANDRSGYEARWSNLTGHYYMPRSGALVELSGTSHLSLLDTCQSSTFYCMGQGNGRVTAVINGEQSQSFDLSPGGHSQAVTVRGRIGRVEWRIDQADPGLVGLGVSMDCQRGVVVDNFALRSTSGMHLQNISEQMFSDLDQVRHYDLVILMYGLNVATKKTSEYTAYRKIMVENLDKMKRAMPETGFLVVSVADREQKSGDTFRTMPGVVSMVNAQQRIAYDSRVAFWNLYTAMGGEGSMVRLVEQKMANLDYTHINFRGGGHLAQLLYDVIVWGQEQYLVQSQNGGRQ